MLDDELDDTHIAIITIHFTDDEKRDEFDDEEDEELKLDDELFEFDEVVLQIEKVIDGVWMDDDDDGIDECDKQRLHQIVGVLILCLDDEADSFGLDKKKFLLDTLYQRIIY